MTNNLAHFDAGYVKELRRQCLIRQGRKEVVEWMASRREGGYNFCVKIHWEEYSTQLKKWGVK